jgi:hypothetical protein
MTFRDVIVLLLGITGRVLANAQGKEVWSPSGAVIWRAVTSLRGSLKDLELDASSDELGVTATRRLRTQPSFPA